MSACRGSFVFICMWTITSTIVINISTSKASENDRTWNDVLQCLATLKNGTCEKQCPISNKPARHLRECFFASSDQFDIRDMYKSLSNCIPSSSMNRSCFQVPHKISEPETLFTLELFKFQLRKTWNCLVRKCGLSVCLTGCRPQPPELTQTSLSESSTNPDQQPDYRIDKCFENYSRQNELFLDLCL